MLLRQQRIYRNYNMPIQHGVLPVIKRHTNYSARTFGGVVPLTYTDFNLDAGFGFPDQNAEGLPEACTGFTQSELCQDEDKAQYDPRDTYTRTLLLENARQGSPCSVYDSLRVVINPGPKGKNEITNTGLHKRNAYYMIEENSADPGNWFDSVISTMEVTQRAISLATPWFPVFESIGPNGIMPEVFPLVWQLGVPGHNHKICGVKMINGLPYLVDKTWQGPNYGDHGYNYWSRTAFNNLMKIGGSGAFMVSTQPVSGQILTVHMPFWEYVASVLRQLFTKQTPMPQPMNPIPAPAPIVPATPSVDTLLPWDTTTSLSHANYHNVRVICDLEGLSLEQKDILTSCVWVESEFNVHAKMENKDKVGRVWSTDNGICQWNDYFHGTEITPDQAVNDPEMAVRLMCSYWKAGKENQWVSFTSGAYKAYLGHVL